MPTSSSPPASSDTAPSTEASTPRPPTTQAGSPLNVTKFGLLPKRPVSLLSPQNTGARQRRDDDDDEEDELEYVESPFDTRNSK